MYPYMPRYHFFQPFTKRTYYFFPHRLAPFNSSAFAKVSASKALFRLRVCGCSAQIVFCVHLRTQHESKSKSPTAPWAKESMMGMEHRKLTKVDAPPSIQQSRLRFRYCSSSLDPLSLSHPFGPALSTILHDRAPEPLPAVQAKFRHAYSAPFSFSPPSPSRSLRSNLSMFSQQTTNKLHFLHCFLSSISSSIPAQLPLSA